MSNNTSSPFLTSFSDSAEFERLPDGLYQAVIVGVVAKDYHKFKSETEMVTKVSFIIQCSNNSETFYFRTAPYTHTIGSKSNLMVFINTSTGYTLEKLKEKFPLGFPLEKLIGVPVQIVVTTSTNDEGKTYSNLTNTLKAPKGVSTPIIPDEIPAYLVRNAKFFQLADGLTVKEDTAAAKAPAFPAGLPGGLASVGAGKAAPAAPANAKVTQNADPKAFMNPQLQVTQPAAQPATAVPASEQAPDQGEDSDPDDLPFN